MSPRCRHSRLWGWCWALMSERRVTELHATPRLNKALATLQRLRVLELPSSLCCLLWRTAVLPQALYGCV